MKPHCETIVQVVLPGIRALVAKELMESHNLTQQQAAEKLGVSQAAISQYRRDIRGYKIKILQKDNEIMKEVADMASKIVSGEKEFFDTNLEVCKLCNIIRKNKTI